MKKIINVIAAVLLAGQVGYMPTLYAASSQELSKSKHSTSKKANKTKSAKNKSDKSSSKQAEKSKSDKKTTTAKKGTTKSTQKTQSAKNNSSVDKSKLSEQKESTKSTVTSVSTTPKKETLASEITPTDVASMPTQTSNPTTAVTPVNHTPVDCLYELSSTASTSEKELAEWAQLAITKSFDYRFDTLETQLQKLKACYTEQGWLGFNNALKQSGNLATIKAQQLTVSCEIEGKLKVNPFKNNQWKITVPLKVVYQNTQEKLTQRLFVEMVVTKKSATQLGIVQIIAEPKSQNSSKEGVAS